MIREKKYFGRIWSKYRKYKIFYQNTEENTGKAQIQKNSGIRDISRKSGWVISQNTDQISKYRPNTDHFLPIFPKSQYYRPKVFLQTQLSTLEYRKYRQDLDMI